MKRAKDKIDFKTLEETPSWEWPEGARDLLLRTLRDDQANPSERLIAAELAGDYATINDELADILLSIVQSAKESEKLRGRAVISLGPVLEGAYIDEFEDPEDVPITEETFHRIEKSLREIYSDPDTPKEVGRRVLEASVRSPQDWHQDAIRDAYGSSDEAWKLTAVFCMRFVRGFNDQVLEALESENQDIHYEAVCAAGNWGLDAAWPHIVGLLAKDETDKSLRLAAIEAIANIRPQEAAGILVDFTESDDEDIVDAAYEAMALAGGIPDDEYDDKDKTPLN